MLFVEDETAANVGGSPFFPEAMASANQLRHTYRSRW
jgi:hypothetical protein